MCKVYNQIGCLKAIKSHLQQHNLDQYNSIKQLIDFQKNYSVARQQIISNHKLLIEQEKSILSDDIAQLEQAVKEKKEEVEQHLLSELEKLKYRIDNLPSMSSNIMNTAINYVKKADLKLRVWNNKRSFNSKLEHSVEHLMETNIEKNKRYQYILANFENAVTECGWPHLQELDRKKRIIEKINNFIYGALGEQKVVKELEKLSDDYILINDFDLNFKHPIYNRQERDYIQSIQIDHILIALSGVFLIETKNWSQQSLENRSLHSPIHQIKRTNFALYKILTGGIFPLLNKHHWGNRKIPIRNLIVLVNHKPIEEFEHVKILSLNELTRHVQYFKPCLSISDTQMIAEFLLNFNK